MSKVLEICDLEFTYSGNSKTTIHDINLCLEEGKSLGITGESGSGKTTLGLQLLQLAKGTANGVIQFHGRDILGLSQDELRELRWSKISMCFQNSLEALNPVYSVRDQVAEPIISHDLMTPEEAAERAEELLSRFGVTRFNAYPHELSDGQRQLVLLAMSLACDPELIIVDEPTSNLDPLTRKRIVETLSEIRGGKSLIVISHDLDTIAHLCDNTAVLYAGTILEYGDTEKIISDPRHPYTFALLKSYPVMTTSKNLLDIRGSYDPTRDYIGCVYCDRCTQTVSVCSKIEPKLAPISDDHLIRCHLGGLETLIAGKRLSKTFKIKNGSVEALRDVSIRVREGEVLGIVGETGSGKTTLAKILSGIIKPDEGEVIFKDVILSESMKNNRRETCSQLQYIPQDAKASVNPRLTVLEAVKEPLIIQKKKGIEEKVYSALSEAGLSTSTAFTSKRVSELSGGELKRLCLARVLTLNPKMIIADEPTSDLDASLQARYVLHLLEIQKNRGLGLIIITHNIALARKICDRIAVFKDGVKVEEGNSNQVISNPLMDYTKMLVEAAPKLI